MAIINKSIISKAIFSISVVGMTASVGFVGLAQANHRGQENRVNSESEGGNNGYGGNGAALAAAVTAFQTVLSNANSQFETSVAACSSTSPVNPTATTTFRKASTNAVSDFSAQTASPTTFGSTAKFDSQFRNADNDFQNRLDEDENNLVSAEGNRSTYRSCVNTARNKYHNSIQIARTAFRNALHSIFNS